MRYNNITKQRLADIEAVKKTILEEHKPASSNQIQEKLKRYKQNIPQKDDRHKRKCDILLRQIETKHSYDLVMIENQVNLLVRCQELIDKLKKAVRTPKEFNKEIAEAFLPVYTVVKYLSTERIVGCYVQREINDLNNEITRQKLLFEVHNLGFE